MKILSYFNILKVKIKKRFCNKTNENRNERLVSQFCSIVEKLYRNLGKNISNETRISLYNAISKAEYLAMEAKQGNFSDNESINEMRTGIIELKSFLTGIHEEKPLNVLNFSRKKEDQTETLIINDLKLVA